MSLAAPRVVAERPKFSAITNPQNQSRRVQLDCQCVIRYPKPYMVWFLGPDSMLAVELDPLGMA